MKRFLLVLLMFITFPLWGLVLSLLFMYGLFLGLIESCLKYKGKIW